MDIVALDIETTGLDPEKDAILEIGAVRFNENRVEAEWGELINPGRPVPPTITQLTGITNEMVANAPPLKQVLSKLVEFVNHDPILGHNIKFDLSFLRKHQILKFNDMLDTYDMAAVLLPNASRYSLSALAHSLAVPLPVTHRALDDARTTYGIYLRLHEMALDLHPDLLAEIVRKGENLDWGGYYLFHEALKSLSYETIKPKKAAEMTSSSIWAAEPSRSIAPFVSAEKFYHLDPDETATSLQPGGLFSKHFENFEHRPQQVEMLKSVAQAFSEGRHLLVEAGTGVGKSIAYLVPAALWALHNNTRVVISTNTINLQDQLISKDIPDLKNVLGIDVRASVMKGRSNYMCPRRMEILRRRGPENADEMRVLAKILVWKQENSSGDRGEINLNGPAEREIWWRISAEDEACSTESCLQRMGGSCPYYRARQAAQNAHLLIVNHALLLADVASGNRVLPEYDYLIIDEAHHLEAATTDALSFRITQFEIERLLRELGSTNSGALGWVVSTLSDVVDPAIYAAVFKHVELANDYTFRFENHSRQFFQTIEQFLFELREGRPIGPYAHQERIINATRAQPSWDEVQIAWEEAKQSLDLLTKTIKEIAQTMADEFNPIYEEGLDLYNHVTSLYRRLNDLDDQMTSFVFEPDPEKIYWAEIQAEQKRISLHAAPMHIGSLMERYLWHDKTSVILTSATLTTTGNFEFLKGRLNANDADELALGSPFDYETSTLLYLVNDIPEPNERIKYQRTIERCLIQLCQATSGRTLALFTSYSQLQETSRAIAPKLTDEDIVIYEQGEGASPHALLESFRNSDKAILLGTRAFWEGVDIPGEALSVLVIVRLPFSVPSDPIIAARAEKFEDPFYEYHLPEAILRFRQGFGRLIRTQSDRGIVVVLDRRIMSKRYGRFFLDSLPPCSLKEGSLTNLPREAVRWLNL
ncbi:MAG: DEAD/DEAH box helicase family protein [Anaerolineales bacterium]|nr:DEAD/DEAH box helicase family protein [Anaerolineales bacterium]